MTTRILDIGCGDGRVAEANGWHLDGIDYTGLDIDPDCITAARDRGLDARRVDITDGLPFAADAFDHILAKAILEHVPDPAAVLNECYRVLTPGGDIRVVVPSDRSYDIWGDPTHQRAYRADSLRGQLADAGFEGVEMAGRMGWTSLGQAAKSCYRILAPWTPYGYPRAWDARAQKPAPGTDAIHEAVDQLDAPMADGGHSDDAGG